MASMVFTDCSSSAMGRFFPLRRNPIRLNNNNRVVCRRPLALYSVDSSKFRTIRGPEKWSKLMDGISVASKITDGIAAQVSKMKDAIGCVPCLAIILVGNREESVNYVRLKSQACESAGMKYLDLCLQEDTSEEKVIKLISHFNEDPTVHGILVQLPLPEHMKQKQINILNSVSVEKDVDGIHPLNIGRLAMPDGEPLFLPCTPQACMELLRSYNIPVKGKRAVVLGHSTTVGMPAALLLQRNGATVSIVHSETMNADELTRQADIVISAIGRPNFVRSSWIKPGATVIDVGTNYVEDENSPIGIRLVGDVCDEVYNIVSAITPVPGGVGPVTLAMIASNTLLSAQRMHNLSQISNSTPDAQ